MTYTAQDIAAATRALVRAARLDHPMTGTQRSDILRAAGKGAAIQPEDWEAALPSRGHLVFNRNERVAIVTFGRHQVVESVR